MKRRRVAMTLSIPPEIAEDYEKIAEREAKNRSQLFRDMFLLYNPKNQINKISSTPFPLIVTVIGVLRLFLSNKILPIAVIPKDLPAFNPPDDDMTKLHERPDGLIAA